MSSALLSEDFYAITAGLVWSLSLYFNGFKGWSLRVSPQPSSGVGNGRATVSTEGQTAATPLPRSDAFGEIYRRRAPDPSGTVSSAPGLKALLAGIIWHEQGPSASQEPGPGTCIASATVESRNQVELFESIKSASPSIEESCDVGQGLRGASTLAAAVDADMIKPSVPGSLDADAHVIITSPFTKYGSSAEPTAASAAANDVDGSSSDNGCKSDSNDSSGDTPTFSEATAVEMLSNQVYCDEDGSTVGSMNHDITKGIPIQMEKQNRLFASFPIPLLPISELADTTLNETGTIYSLSNGRSSSNTDDIGLLAALPGPWTPSSSSDSRTAFAAAAAAFALAAAVAQNRNFGGAVASPSPPPVQGFDACRVRCNISFISEEEEFNGDVDEDIEEDAEDEETYGGGPSGLGAGLQADNRRCNQSFCEGVYTLRRLRLPPATCMAKCLSVSSSVGADEQGAMVCGRSPPLVIQAHCCPGDSTSWTSRCAGKVSINGSPCNCCSYGHVHHGHHSKDQLVNGYSAATACAGSHLTSAGDAASDRARCSSNNTANKNEDKVENANEDGRACVLRCVGDNDSDFVLGGDLSFDSSCGCGGKTDFMSSPSSDVCSARSSARTVEDYCTKGSAGNGDVVVVAEGGEGLLVRNQEVMEVEEGSLEGAPGPATPNLVHPQLSLTSSCGRVEPPDTYGDTEDLTTDRSPASKAAYVLHEDFTNVAYPLGTESGPFTVSRSCSPEPNSTAVMGRGATATTILVRRSLAYQLTGTPTTFPFSLYPASSHARSLQSDLPMSVPTSAGGCRSADQVWEPAAEPELPNPDRVSSPAILCSEPLDASVPPIDAHGTPFSRLCLPTASPRLLLPLRQPNQRVSIASPRCNGAATPRSMMSNPLQHGGRGSNNSMVARQRAVSGTSNLRQHFHTHPHSSTNTNTRWALGWYVTHTIPKPSLTSGMSFSAVESGSMELLRRRQVRGQLSQQVSASWSNFECPGSPCPGYLRPTLSSVAKSHAPHRSQLGIPIPRAERSFT